MPKRVEGLKKVKSFFDNALKVFTFDEGNKIFPYKDSQGYWTIGIGHLIGESLEELRLSQNIVDEIFREDLATAIREARFMVGGLFFDSIAPARQLALISMLYTLGVNKFLKFEDTIDAIKKEAWDDVASHILQSKWARDVDPKQRLNEGRDDRVAYMFQTGKFHSDYNIKENQ